MASNENGNGTKFFAPTITLVTILTTLFAILGGLSSVVSPMRFSIDSLQKQVDSARNWQEDYVRGKIPSSAEKQLGEVNIKFTEVETQFRNLNERTQRMELNLDQKLKSLEEKMVLEIKLNQIKVGKQ